ncbi:MAG UNVERIFIED_CONTAM: membrane protein insertion efficiency factor YidD [Rickettsiaceae bacterium]
MTNLLLLIIRFYQITISPYLGKNCRFVPTCSEYAIEAIKNKGPMYGCWLIVRRVLKCHPFHPGGLDNPPR